MSHILKISNQKERLSFKLHKSKMTKSMFYDII